MSWFVQVTILSERCLVAELPLRNIFERHLYMNANRCLFVDSAELANVVCSQEDYATKVSFLFSPVSGNWHCVLQYQVPRELQRVNL